MVKQEDGIEREQDGGNDKRHLNDRGTDGDRETTKGRNEYHRAGET